MSCLLYMLNYVVIGFGGYAEAMMFVFVYCLVCFDV